MKMEEDDLNWLQALGEQPFSTGTPQYLKVVRRMPANDELCPCSIPPKGDSFSGCNVQVFPRNSHLESVVAPSLPLDKRASSLHPCASNVFLAKLLLVK
jgi:hypothetical protein